MHGLERRAEGDDHMDNWPLPSFARLLTCALHTQDLTSTNENNTDATAIVEKLHIQPEGKYVRRVSVIN